MGRATGENFHRQAKVYFSEMPYKHYIPLSKALVGKAVQHA